MAVRKTKAGANLKRWFKEKWTDQKGNPCGSNKTKGVKKCRPSKKVSSKTPVTWGQMSKSQKSKAVKDKKSVGMGRKSKPIKRRSNAKKSK